MLCALDAFKSRIQNSHVNVHTDSRALLGPWQSEGRGNTKINDVIKAILRCSQEFNFSIDMQYVPSAENPATLPRVNHHTSIVPFLRRCGPVSRECLGHIPLISCRSTVTAAVLCLVIVYRISRHATPLSHLASTCLATVVYWGKPLCFSPLCA